MLAQKLIFATALACGCYYFWPLINGHDISVLNASVKPLPAALLAVVAIFGRNKIISLLTALALVAFAYSDFLPAEAYIAQWRADSLCFFSGVCLLIIRFLSENAGLQLGLSLPYLGLAAGSVYVLRPGLDDDEVMPVALMAFAIAVMAWRCSCCGLGGSAGWVRDFAGALLVLSQGASAVDHFMRKLPQPAGELLITCSYWLALALITDTEFLTPLPQKKGKAATKATKQA